MGPRSVFIPEPTCRLNDNYIYDLFRNRLNFKSEPTCRLYEIFGEGLYIFPQSGIRFFFG
jgi:hypothetical protein